MEVDHNELGDANVDGTRIARACDSCRTRKIRCDRASPCSNCVASKLICHTTVQAQKIPRQRVHISEEYTKKIDRIEDRLAGIEHVLAALTSKLDNFNLRSSSETPSAAVKSGPSPSTLDVTAPESTFEGETTLNSHSEFARNLLERVVVNTPSIEENAELKAALTNLQTIVKMQKVPPAERSVLFWPTLQPDTSKIDRSGTRVDRPPWDAVEAVLDWAIESPTITFTLVFPFVQVQNFRNIFVEVYAKDDTPYGQRIIVYGLLYNLFQEFNLLEKVKRRNDDYSGYIAKCRHLLESAIFEMTLFIPASYENILALLLAASYYVEMCRPSICWTLTCTAANMCQTLGYHRYSSMADDTKEEKTAKIHLFWFTYIMDKSMSLRLGRPAVIQDWDVSIPEPTIETTIIASLHEGVALQSYWIKIARIQGETYEKLFSPAAFQKPEAERMRIASELINALNEGLVERTQIDAQLSAKYGDHSDIFHYADVVMHYSIMTLIQRAVTPDPSTFSYDCVESARAALVAHQQCSSKFNVKGNEEVWTGYLHWAIMQAPFTPFIVLFCNALARTDRTDLQTLSDFVSSLESCRSLSEGADKLYKLCHVFLQIAKLYVEAKERERENQIMYQQASNGQFYSENPQSFDTSALEQFDPYLSALGLAPNSGWPMGNMATDVQTAGTAAASFQTGFETNPNALQEWFSGSRYIMGLMEEDMTMF